ncbi:gfo/Idh/MocA family oxidoreductase [Leisingera sp. ANG59]|nr:gfo/Idh/MocA family oxidoreductase [Leisingera sp. ANG59]
MQAPTLRWGILGSGWIAERFIESARAHTRQEIAAVGSRSQEKANTFARTWDIDTAHGSYQALVADDSLDVIYVATPHNLHLGHVRLALEAGCNVLVEKPMGLSHAEATEMVALAREKGVFFAEALWTYFLPKFDVIQQLLDTGVLGEIKSVHTEYGEFFTRDHRIFKPALAGGPLLDLGTYPVSFLTKLLGIPDQLVGFKQDDPSGVHGQLSVIMANAAGNQGTMSTTLYGLTPTNAAVVGTSATLRFGSEFNLPGPFELISADGGKRLTWNEPVGRHYEGLCYEAAEVARSISEGRVEARSRPLAATLETMATLDLIRAATGIEFSQSQEVVV